MQDYRVHWLHRDFAQCQPPKSQDLLQYKHRIKKITTKTCGAQSVRCTGKHVTRLAAGAHALVAAIDVAVLSDSGTVEWK